jgi:phage terminase small subunit
MKEKEKAVELTGKQRRFCEEYIFDFNGTRAAKAAGYSDNTAAEIACENLTKPQIQAYIKDLQSDLEKTSGISRMKVLREHEKLAFSSIAHLHDTWITRKTFDTLTDEQKSCIAEISTQTRFEKDYSTNPDGTVMQVDYVKIKLYDKQKALDSISKMLGFDAPDKIEHDIKGLKTFKIVGAAGKGNTGK